MPHLRSWPLLALTLCCALVQIAWLGGLGTPSGLREAWGVNMQWFEKQFRENGQLRLVVLKQSHPSNILHAGDRLELSVRLINQGELPLNAQVRLLVVQYGTRTPASSGHAVFLQEFFKISDVGEQSMTVVLPSTTEKSKPAFIDLDLAPQLPDAFGAYAVLLDVPGQDRLLVALCTRVVTPPVGKVQFPRLTLDESHPASLQRLGIKGVRLDTNYMPTWNEEYHAYCVELKAKLADYHAHDVTVLMMGMNLRDKSGKASPLPLGRPWLDAQDFMQAGKMDLSWTPACDSDFTKFVLELNLASGWPKGPLIGWHLWNEPWEGTSISGWGADMPRYREIYSAMAKGCRDASATGEVQVLVGGCDSSSNALDKLFGDGSPAMLDLFDFVSCHYQGIAAPSTYRLWRDRKHANGPVQVWDTESWMANSEDRVPVFYGAARSAGYDRVLGVNTGQVILDARARKVPMPEGKPADVPYWESGPAACAVALGARLIGEREAKGALFPDGLPWVFEFAGLPAGDGKQQQEDATLVVCGDLGQVYIADSLPFRSVGSLDEVGQRKALEDEKAALAAQVVAVKAKADGAYDDSWLQERRIKQIDEQLGMKLALRGVRLVLADPEGRFRTFDHYGNERRAVDGRMTLPLDGAGSYLRGDGRPGSYAALRAAVLAGRVEGYEAVEVVLHDFTRRIAPGAELKIDLRNILNRPVAGTLALAIPGLQLDPAEQSFSLAPGERRSLVVRVAGGSPNPGNSYPCTVRLDAGADGRFEKRETLHADLITRLTPVIDGKLDEWDKALPLSLTQQGGRNVSFAEEMWKPFMEFSAEAGGSAATAWTAWDDGFFYFAAKIADTTPHPGMRRWATLDADEFFYPEVAKKIDMRKSWKTKPVTLAAEEATLPRLASGDGRSNAAWGSAVQEFAIDLDLPKDRLTQIACYLMDGTPKINGRYAANPLLNVIDRGTGKLMFGKRVSTRPSNGIWMVIEVAGSVRLQFAGQLPCLAVLAFDASSSKNAVKTQGKEKTPATTALFLNEDLATRGDWTATYGKLGSLMPGQPGQPGAGISATWLDEVKIDEFPWPKEVRRFSYRQDTEVPFGQSPGRDNVQLAFNALPLEQDPWVYPSFPGVPDRLAYWHSTDHEFALNPIAPAYGGGFEIWRCLLPGMPIKHFYPRQGASPQDGPVAGGKMVQLHQGSTRIVEAAIPWSEMPAVKAKLDRGEAIKFGFRINHDQGRPMDWNTDRSVSSSSGMGFHPSWNSGWACETEFGWER
jgi:hypothetical protein